QPVYIGVDDRPAPQFEVESWLAEQMGVEVRPAEVRPAEAQPRVVAPAGHKRCRNRALHSSGYQLLYPDYKSGYAATLAEA
ncbi:MAG: hypothetical protein V7700_18240, partial [Halioglobus sp.]